MIKNKRPADQNHYAVIAQAIEYIRTNLRRQPSLGEIASAVELSEFHLQRVFSEWAGISPKRFLQYLTKEYARNSLLSSNDLLSTSLESGLSGPGRLHDLMVTCEAMSPGEIKQQGLGLCINYGLARSPFGIAMIAWTERGIVGLSFHDLDHPELSQGLQQTWPMAELQRNDLKASQMIHRIFSRNPEPTRFHLLLKGSNFQIKVWEALLNIGTSQLISYTTMAQLAGSPKAHRAAGTALAENRIAFLIPCHRVIRSDGETGIYHWGDSRKLALLAWEAAQRNKDSRAC
ncbi:MAG: bifunctional helix-turn-helix domain-containing protein/methylated-DNA--[protein]-cysteine S-methyltransferase [Candidatus Thiodiazotropha sp. (ex. Lucinisca nassula)]|nr:bifunctional helix-turn-helix domain-containing protein/methylated-DNA--[protein]-cysteine S-methyltransferase [Candidatus Thiodiazotropha sp. (ex. Lucinisca nassula)]MBW9269863.1 bifunctional helix-turn-helix domain-containing protein/methylated-DNA--[protein]-cysteine S-methyltransferase [Candidatus Thiodiazotropha sp. (ex. Lucinisca nassula)]